MSYAEMEGFSELPDVSGSRADAWQEALETRLVERWLGTVFLVLLIGIVLTSMFLG